PRRAGRHAPVPRGRDRDRRVLEHVRVRGRHPRLLLDPRAPRPGPPCGRRLPRAARGGAPARARRGGRDRRRPGLPPAEAGLHAALSRIHPSSNPTLLGSGGPESRATSGSTPSAARPWPPGPRCGRVGTPRTSGHPSHDGRDSRPMTTTPHSAWLPDDAFAAVGRRRVVVAGDGALAGTVAEEVAAATARFGGSFSRLEVGDGVADAELVLTLTPPDAVLPPDGSANGPGSVPGAGTDADPAAAAGTTEPGGDADESFRFTRDGGAVVVQAPCDAGLLHGLFHVVRLGEAAFDGPDVDETHAPATGLRM